MSMIFNIGLYQIIWFLCVLGENRGAVFALPLLGLHLFLSPYKKADIQMMALLVVAGGIIDGMLHYTGYLQFNAPAMPIPLWLAVIWLALATLPHHSLAWLKGRLLLSAVFGAMGGTLAYWAGVRMGAASFPATLAPSLFLLALLWAGIWPSVMYFASRKIPISRFGRSNRVGGPKD